MVQQHAAMLAFVEAFWVMDVVFLLMLPFLPLLQYSKLARSPKIPPAEKVVIPSKRAEDWPDVLEHNYDEEHDLVLHH